MNFEVAPESAGPSRVALIISPALTRQRHAIWLKPLIGRALEGMAIRTGRTYGFCLVCGGWTWFRISSTNVREDCVCGGCGSINRQRQIASVLLQRQDGDVRANSLHDFHPRAGFCLYNTESSGSIHERLKSLPGYVSSDYFGPDLASGDIHSGVMHQDLQRLSFPDGSFDLVLSSEVFEHIPDPYRAHHEVLRVLKPGGRHIFTVPFDPGTHSDDIRAQVDPDGSIRHVKPAEYHGDPLRPETGILVYTIFGREMLPKLEAIGFIAQRHELHKPWFGIVGPGTIVFEAAKPAETAVQADLP